MDPPDEYELPGCGGVLLALVLFGIPELVSLTAFGLGASYGSDDTALVLAYGTVAIAGIALAVRGAIKESVVAHGLIFVLIAILLPLSAYLLS